MHSPRAPLAAPAAPLPLAVRPPADAASHADWPAPCAPLVQVGLVCAEPHLRQVLVQDLLRDPRTDVLRQARSLREARHMDLAGLDVLLLARELPDGSALQALPVLLARRPELRVLVVARTDDDDGACAAIAQGAAGWLALEAWEGSLAAPVLLLAQGGAAVGVRVLQRLLRHQRPLLRTRPAGEPGPRALLTPRERQVLEMVGQGLRSKEVARLLAISDETVNAHVKSVYRKLQVRSRAHAVRIAAQQGLL